MSLLRAVHNGNHWEFESVWGEWEVTGAWAFPCHKYRRMLSVFVRTDWQFASVKIQWRPELDPFAFTLKIHDSETLLCWHRETGSLVLLVPSEAHPVDREFCLKEVQTWLTFVTLMQTDASMLPLSSLIDQTEGDETSGWHVSAPLNL